MSARTDFEQAKQFQIDWMQDIRNFIDNKTDIDEEEILSSHDSKLGKWYYSKGKSKYGEYETIKKFEVKQVKLHRVAKQILEAIHDKHPELAEELYEDLEGNSNTIIHLLNQTESAIINNTSVIAVHDESLMQNSNKSVAWDKTKVLNCMIDLDGIIEYVNGVFTAVSGYDSSELIEKPFANFLHPDMPNVIYKLLWDELKTNKQSTIIIKNRAKSGKYYWVGAEFKIVEKSSNDITYSVNLKGLDVELINKIIEPLYKNLSEVEQKSGTKSSENFFYGYLEERNRTIDDFFQNLIKTGRDSVNDGQKGFLGFFKRG